MTQEEKRRLENVFIKLKGDGKAFEEIMSELLAIEREELVKWNDEYDKALANYKSKSPSPIEVTISEKDETGRYIFQSRLSLNLSMLEKIKFDLVQAFSLDIEKIPDITAERIELFKSLVEESKEHHTTFSKYFRDITINTADDIRNYSATYHLNTDEPEIKIKAEKAIKFYLQNIFFHDEIRRKKVIIKEDSKDIYQNASEILPFALKQFHVKNYQGIIDTGIQNMPVDAKWIFITGENGYGKTSILQAILMGLYGTKDKETDLLSNSDCNIAIEFKNQNQNIINHTFGFGFKSIKNIVCYGPSRLLIQSPESQNSIDMRIGLTYSLFNPDGILLNIGRELVLWKLANDEKFEQVKKIFLKLIPHLSDIQIKDNREVVYIEKELSDTLQEYEPLPFDKLASGFRSIIAMIGDMIARFYEYQPHILNPEEFKGIAIIDELDLHWHPKLQKRLPELFSSAFPHVQFIVTTHSVIPFLGAPKNSVFLKVRRTKEKGVEIEQLDLNIKNLLPNVLLTSSLFDMDSVKQINNENRNEIRTEDSFSAMKENDNVTNNLNDFELGNQKFSDDLFNDDEQ